MKGKWFLGILSLFLLVSLVACSSGGGSKNSSSSMDKSAQPKMKYDTNDSQSSSKASADSGTPKKDEAKDTPNPANERMIIYNAELSVTVKDFNKAQRLIQTLIDKANGYTVQSDVTKFGNDGHGGTIVARIPQPHFDSFIKEVSKTVYKVETQRISGEDVTKEYVDLKSRLQAKEAVEARLNAFLKQAKDTDDLLKISDDLGRVQEEIESIKGQMNYLKNHSDLSTVTINLTEKAVKIKDKKDLNTWDRTKNAFIGSINAIVTFFSGLFVFLVGFSPILVPILVIAGAVYYIYRRRNKNE
jgi:hypothetical protein